MADRVVITCTKEALVDVLPCLTCASETELDIIWLYLWMRFWRLDPSEDLFTLIGDSACLTCMSEREIKQAKIAVWYQFLYAGGYLDIQSTEELFDDLKCMNCMTPQQIRAAVLWLVCGFLSDILLEV